MYLGIPRIGHPSTYPSTSALCLTKRIWRAWALVFRFKHLLTCIRFVGYVREQSLIHIGPLDTIIGKNTALHKCQSNLDCWMPR